MAFRNLYTRVNQNCKHMELITRPNSSPGLWLSFLIPIAYLTSSLKYQYSSLSFEYRMTSIAAWGLCLQSINFFFYIIFGGRIFLRLLLALLPGFVLAASFNIFLHQTLSVSIFWGFLYIIFYQFIFIKLIRRLPKCFTFGEATVVAQGLTLFIFTSILQIPYFIEEPPVEDFAKMNAILMEGLFCVIIFSWLILTLPSLRNTAVFYWLLIILCIIIFCIPVTPDLPIIEVFNFIVSDSKRIFVIIFDIGMVGVGAAAIMWQVNKTEKATTSVRKIFHLLYSIVFIFGLLYQCTLFYLSTGVALCGMIILELMRIAQIYPISEFLNNSFNIFADEKDVGNIALTPFYLIIGCSMPLWILPSTCGMEGTFIIPNTLMILISGVLTVGIGDSFASFFGSKIGKHNLSSSSKTVEGLIANILFQGLTLAQFYTLDLIVLNYNQIAMTSVAVVIVSLIEAYTDQVDNIVLPLVFFNFANIILLS